MFQSLNYAKLKLSISLDELSGEVGVDSDGVPGLNQSLQEVNRSFLEFSDYPLKSKNAAKQKCSPDD